MSQKRSFFDRWCYLKTIILKIVQNGIYNLTQITPFLLYKYLGIVILYGHTVQIILYFICHIALEIVVTRLVWWISRLIHDGTHIKQLPRTLIWCFTRAH